MEGTNHGRQQLSFEDEDYDFTTDIYYQCHDNGGHDYKARHQAIFHVNRDEDLHLPPYEGRAGGLDGGGINLLCPPHPMQTFGEG